ncbi:NUDIX hydrolase [Paenibacillus glycanilyticus]|uniref:7,8-dihydro-8-oxoguanine triphosphatase n=1 Tax=Paenibacillus glycanilyticus TaxID=126569 RepID=A0ABQ6G8Y8_9BACL|nr:8-oxo-dGTP diphosphatase [Paenibacillus glycanilyticus]GLX65756.1 7,8-dihydro-8-oxoguanine triphosphatase [Paenibacillus glycanilyticus]
MEQHGIVKSLWNEDEEGERVIAYTICFIRRGNELLLLNREKPSWMGCWNGVGGKLEPGETPLESVKREVAEETGLTDCPLLYKGLVTWTSNGAKLGGMYLYLGELPELANYKTPVKTDEGILDWKSLDWILHPENKGVTSNLPVFLANMLEEAGQYDYNCTYRDGNLVSHRTTPIDASTEELAATIDYMARAYLVRE